MGLDMYLTAEVYLSEYDEADKTISGAVANALGVGGQFTVRGVEIRVGYWRKANAIHKWFVDNVQDGVDECKAHRVDKGDLETLREACLEVLEDRKLAKTLLPTMDGFCFGDTSYGEGYEDDLRHTVEIIDKALTLDPQKWDFKYQSSW